MRWPRRLDQILPDGPLPCRILRAKSVPVAALLCSALLTLMVGCQTPAQPFDPFLAGRTTIPPPGTAVPSSSAPYYNGGPPAVVMPGQPAINPGTNFPPPGPINAAPPPSLPAPSTSSPGFLPRGISLPQSAAPPPSSFQLSSAQPGNDAGTRLVNSTPPNQVYFDPRSLTASSSNQLPVSGSSAEPFAATLRADQLRANQPLDRSAGLPEIGDLPAARTPMANQIPTGSNVATATQPFSPARPTTMGTVTPAAANVPSGVASSVRPASGNWQPTANAQASANTMGPSNLNSPATSGGAFQPLGNSSNPATAPRDAYGHDPQYRWLKGKLEYSQSSGRWKLRYIPVDGTTDDYGGSVELPDANRLGGLQPGDLVTVEGRVTGNAATSSHANGKSVGTGSFAPSYAIDRIAKQ